MSQLSVTSGVTVPSIKYYLREGLLPAGEPTGVNQADHGDAHVRRLRFIRALIDIGGLSVASARGVIDAVDDPALPLSHVFATAQRAVSQCAAYAGTPTEAALERLAGVVSRRGWRVSPGNPGVVAAVIDAFASAMWAVMATSIIVLWVATLLVCLLLFRASLGDRTRALAIRAGAAISLLGLGLGYLMTSPTATQLADFRGIRGHHSGVRRLAPRP